MYSATNSGDAPSNGDTGTSIDTGSILTTAERSDSAHCSDCGQLNQQPTTIHTVHECKDCDKTIYRTPSAEGLAIAEGDKVVIPAGALHISLDRRKSSGQFSRHGVSWMVEKLFLDSAPKSKEDLDSSLDTYDREAEEVFRSSELVDDLDLDDQDQLNEAIERVCAHREAPAFWAWTILALSTGVRKALESNEASQAAWLMSRLESSRSMLIYRLHLEALTWQGYSTPGLETLRAANEIWDSQRDNSSEEFWQITLTQNPVLLYQAFNVPVILHQGKAYLGGKKLDNHGGKYVDFVLKNSTLGTMALVEIKTPKAKLLGSQYRSGVFGPSFELSGAVSQVLHYRKTMAREYYRHRAQDAEWESAEPSCIVIAGNATQELDSTAKRESFELYRSALSGVTIVTFDELFNRIKQITTAISSFSL